LIELAGSANETVEVFLLHETAFTFPCVDDFYRRASINQNRCCAEFCRRPIVGLTQLQLYYSTSLPPVEALVPRRFVFRKPLVFGSGAPHTVNREIALGAGINRIK
jgi:hypothetical protein